MTPIEKQAAQLLKGKTLEGGWKVLRKIELSKNKSGGMYSCCYEVENGDRKGFLKAFDFSNAERAGMEATDQISDILNAFKLEREILELCSTVRCRNIIELLSYGDIEIPEAEKYPRVNYLILEYAEKGDVRDVMEEKKDSLKWKLKSLHQLAKGLNQLHTNAIAHQDIKPSNVVTTGDDITKLTDFGSAIFLNKADFNVPTHLKSDYAGSWEYAPPELLYGYISRNDTIRRIGCDLYLLGSMIAFYVTNSSMTALIRDNLSKNFCWTNPLTYGKFEEIQSYLIVAYEQALEDISRRIDDQVFRTQLTLIVKYLCHPNPERRGHQKNINQLGPNYGLNRIITIFDTLVTRVIIKNRENGSNF